jgi:hypothetical protein
LFAGFRVVKAQNTPCHQPAAGRHRHGSLTSKPHLHGEGGGELLVILSPVSSAIEVRTVIGRAPAASPVLWMALGTANAPEIALDAGALVKHAGK